MMVNLARRLDKLERLANELLNRNLGPVYLREGATIPEGAGFEAQIKELKAAGCDRIFQEQVSAVSAERKQLEAAFEFMREGDCLVVTKLDRLARSVADLCKILAELEQRKVSFRVLNMNLDTNTPTGKLIINVLGSIAQLERELIKERMLVGIAKAKAEGKYKGRKPTARAKADKVKQLRAAGVGPSEIARQLSIGRTSVFRILTA